VVYYQNKLSEKQYQKQQTYAVEAKRTCFKEQTYFIVLCILSHSKETGWPFPALHVFQMKQNMLVNMCKPPSQWKESIL
jgi:hypothetical protein